MRKQSPLNFAHRGFKREYPENTMLAFDKAVELGVDGIEFDVHLSKDGIPVIIHDETLERTSGVGGVVKELSFSELQKFNVAKNFGLNEKLPSLEDYFNYIKTKDIISNIELKNSIFPYEGIEQAVYSLIKKYKLEEKCVISSFNHESIIRMKELAPELKYGFLSDSWLVNPIKYLKEHKIQCYHPSFYRISKEFVSSFHAENIEVNTWPHSVAIDYKTLIKSGVDIIISDDPDQVAKLLATNSQ